jgi:hypothetical protein
MATLPLSPDTYTERTKKQWQTWRQTVTHSVTHIFGIIQGVSGGTVNILEGGSMD